MWTYVTNDVVMSSDKCYENLRKKKICDLKLIAVRWWVKVATINGHLNPVEKPLIHSKYRNIHLSLVDNFPLDYILVPSTTRTRVYREKMDF